MKSSTSTLRMEIEALLQDLRYALRLFRRSPGFTATGLSIIALGIGAATAAFTLLDHGQFWRPGELRLPRPPGRASLRRCHS